MHKKPPLNVTKSPRVNPIGSPAANHEETRRVLRLLQAKIMNSTALNGGFDALMVKIEAMETRLGTTGEKVDSIHEAVYHPDSGLFARVKSVELWQANEEKVVEKVSEINAAHDKLVKTHEDQLKDLARFKDRTSAAIKWLVVSLATGGAGLVGKLLFDFLSGHVRVV